MYKDIKEYIKRCSVCAQSKGRQNIIASAIHPLPIPKSPWQDISVDLVIGLPIVQGFDGVCMVIDHFIKEIIIFSIAFTITTVKLASEFKDKVWRKHGLPESILSDHGSVCVLVLVGVARTVEYQVMFDVSISFIRRWTNREDTEDLTLVYLNVCERKGLG